MKSLPLVSILINNYNYARYLSQAIDSALSQTYRNIEVIVVDDGSTDSSKKIIEEYGSEIIPILKANGGQASAINAAFQASRGEILTFLDADDTFYPHKIDHIVNIYKELTPLFPKVSLSHSFDIIDEANNSIDIDILSGLREWRYIKETMGVQRKPKDWNLVKISSPERAYKFSSNYRFIPYLGSPTSGFSFTRALAEDIFPIPEENVKISADDFIAKASALIGTVYSTDVPLGQYRVHSKNNFHGQKKPHSIEFLKVLDDFLNSKLQQLGKKPVLSYFDSTHAKSYYRRYYGYHCAEELYDLAFRVIRWRISFSSLSFFSKTILLSAYFRLKSESATTQNL